jgi:hypothetical protein
MTIQPYEAPIARIDMRNHVTDSWTDVLEPVADLAGKIAGTEFVPQALRGSVAKVAAAVLAGREMGIAPMQALSSIHVINGRPGLSAELMRALILQAGHEIKFSKSSAAQCVMRGRRRGEDDWTEVSYTLQEAKDAGDYAKNANYKSRPAEMLVARCTTRLARMVFPDAIHGMRSIEELQDMIEGDATDVPVTVEQVETSTVSRAPRAVEGAPSRQGAQAEGGADSVGDAAPPSPPERKRPPLRGRVTKPQEPVSEPEAVEPTPAQQEAQEDLQPDPEPQENVKQASVTPIEERQRKAVQAAVMQFNRLGITERQERVYWTGALAGRQIASTNDLNLSDLRAVVGHLERLKDRASLEALGATLEAERESQSDE